MNTTTDGLRSLHEPYEERVVVTRGNSPDRCFGVLSFSPTNGVELQLEEFIDDFPQAREFSKYPVLSGTLWNGHPFSLIDAFDTRAETGPGQTRRTIVASGVLCGAALPTRDEKMFLGANVSLTSVDEWYGSAAFKEDQTAAPDPSFTTSYQIASVSLPRFGFSPLHEGSSLLSGQRLVSRGDAMYSHRELHREVTLQLVFRRPYSLDEALKEVYRLQGFLSLCYGHQVYVKWLNLAIRVDGPRREEAEYCWRVPIPSASEKRRIPFPFLGRRALEGLLASMWARWSDRYPIYETCVELYMATELNPQQDLDYKFVAIMQGLETLHRNLVGGDYMPEADYRPIRDKVVAAIPTDLPAGLAGALRARLKWGYQFSLRRRLSDLRERLPTAIAKQVHPQLKGFLDRAVETRNQIAHYGRAVNAEAFDARQKIFGARVLRWFAATTILIDLGIPEDILLQAFGAVGAHELRFARDQCPPLTQTEPPSDA